MRYPVLAQLVLCAALTLWGTAAPALEIEAETVFAATQPTSELQILSTTDTDVFVPIIEAFQRANPGVSVRYVEASSSQISRAIVVENARFDVVISSAMDLQTQLANDGYARQYQSPATALVPEWGVWRDSIFVFTQEPATMVVARAAFEQLPPPTTRLDLIELLRAQPDAFRGRIGTYDVRSSGLGYLFATQDSRTTEAYWRMTELMGQLDVQLYCCSSEMIEDVASGRIAIAYNVLGSYAAARQDLADQVMIIEPADYTTVMSRSAMILATTRNAQGAERFIDHLLVTAWSPGSTAFAYSNPLLNAAETRPNLRRIPLGPGLLVFLDRLKRRQFLTEWENAIVQ